MGLEWHVRKMCRTRINAVVISTQDEEPSGIFTGLTNVAEGSDNFAPEHSIRGFAIGVNEASSSDFRATKKRTS